MTKQDERTIYEWAMPDEAKRHDGFHMSPYSGRWQEWDGVKCEWWDLPRLDMNFAFDVCVPKLNAESVSVTFTNFDDAGRWHLIDAVCGEKVETVDYEAADFYSALLAYIKEVK